jgi:protein involved in polysaccharide export with SLBB domain
LARNIYGLCRSEQALAAEIARVYSRILKNPKIIVRVIDRSKRALARLDGAVRTPSLFRLTREPRLNELIVLAGGLTDQASGEITIYRPRNLSCQSAPAESSSTAAEDNGSRTLIIKISELLSGRPDANPRILSGDMITVERSSSVYVIGAVNNPRPIFTRVEMTLSRAVASAGGLSKDADAGKVTIFRRDASGTKVIEANLFKINRGESNDEVLKPSDIIDVAAKGRGKRKYPPIGANGRLAESSFKELPLRIVD